VIGGLRHPVGPFIGALLFVLMENFATDLISPERFNTLIGSIFLVIVLVSPDGLLGLWRLVSDRMKAGNSRNGGSRRQWRK
jgi:branched-chain amino acid transport system permease protein